jgi:hypothetical protein
MRRITCFIYLLVAVKAAAQSFYSQEMLQRIEITFPSSSWDYILDTAKAGRDGFVRATYVKINGKRYDDVGVKYKGNSSYDSTFRKNPLHIELNTYKDQDHEGFTDIKFGNAYADPSLVREVLSYRILSDYLPCSSANFAQVYINGTYFGVYSNAESVNKDFCRKRYYCGDGTFFKCNPLLTPAVNVKSNLSLLQDTAAYFNYYELKSDYGWAHLRQLSAALTSSPGSLSSYLDVDASLWMLAFNTLLVNLDSYSGVFAQNYYLYRDANGIFQPVVWDLNMCFGGFPFLGSSNTSLANLSISNMKNLPVNIHASDANWPLIKAVQSDPTLRRKYLAHLRTIASDWLSNGKYLTEYTRLKNLVDTAVAADTKKFYSYAQFQAADVSDISVGSYSVPGIQNLVAGRLAYLGTIPDFTVAAPSISETNCSTVSHAQQVTITAKCSGALSVILHYRHSGAAMFTSVTMFDDGQHGDGQAGDYTYGAFLTQQGNHLEYFFYAENNDAGRFSPERAAHTFYTADAFAIPSTGEVVINEVLTNNESDVRNEFHSYQDWIELYNTTGKTLSLDNCYLSDDNNRRVKYRFPDCTTILPHQFMTVWADQFPASKQLHAGFQLDEDGEVLHVSNGLTDLDALSWSAQQKDISIARCPDGYGAFSQSESPSFGLSNCVTGVQDNLGGPQMNIFPNPSSTHLNITVSNGPINITVYSSAGATVDTFTINGSLTIDTSSWPAGLYILKGNSVSSKILIIHSP